MPMDSRYGSLSMENKRALSFWLILFMQVVEIPSCLPNEFLTANETDLFCSTLREEMCLML